MKHIDDNTLAAYLEGTLSDEDREWVEQAIEEDDEAKAVVDEWISMADDFCVEKMQEDDSELRMEACRSIGAVMEKIKGTSGGYRKASGAEYGDTSRCAPMPMMAESCRYSFKQRWPLYRKIIVAASLLAFVSVTGLWLFRSPDEPLRSAPSFDVPAGGVYKDLQPAGSQRGLDTNIQYRDYSELYK